jgi:hypothetical protein
VTEKNFAGAPFVTLLAEQGGGQAQHCPVGRTRAGVSCSPYIPFNAAGAGVAAEVKTNMIIGYMQNPNKKSE